MHMLRPAVVVVALLSTALAEGAPVEKDGLRLVVTTDQESYTIGEPVLVKVAWTNLTDGQLVIRSWDGLSNAPGRMGGDESEPLYDFAIYFGGKERVSYRSDIACGPPGRWVLPPRETIQQQHDVSDTYDLTRPGRYTIRVIYGSGSSLANEVSWVGRLSHPEVEFVMKVEE